MESGGPDVVLLQPQGFEKTAHDKEKQISSTGGKQYWKEDVLKLGMGLPKSYSEKENTHCAWNSTQNCIAMPQLILIVLDRNCTSFSPFYVVQKHCGNCLNKWSCVYV